MRTRILVLVICAGLFGLNGCGGVVFFANTGPGSDGVISVTGTCTSVQLANVPGNDGVLILVTAITLFSNGQSNAFTFCGNVVDRFPLNNVLKVNFRTGTSCANPISIVIVVN